MKTVADVETLVEKARAKIDGVTFTVSDVRDTSRWLRALTLDSLGPA